MGELNCRNTANEQNAIKKYYKHRFHQNLRIY